MSDSAVQGIADTARWVAVYRAQESERPDALFHDSYARRLAGPRGDRIIAELPKAMRNAAWSVVARTVVIDRFIQQQVASGVTLVLNLAAGLDTRPYRLALPPGLVWVEVDEAPLLEEKAALLADVTPNCVLERIAVDLTKTSARRELFRQLNERTTRALVVTEGLIMYLSPDDVRGLAQDLAAVPACKAWVTDLISPGLLKLIDKDWGKTLRAAGAPMRFAPENGPAFFEPLGWHRSDCVSSFTEAAKLNRLPWLFRFFARFPGAHRYNARRPWSGTCLLTRP